MARGIQRAERKILGVHHKTNVSGKNMFWAWYSEYLKSPEWQERRSLVLKRAKGVCEGCGKAEAVDIHHLSYRHKGAEFLFELAALCKACHELVHSDHSRLSLDELLRL